MLSGAMLSVAVLSGAVLCVAAPAAPQHGRPTRAAGTTTAPSPQ
ncbi:hypothetical protein [Cellulomonas shaoxiangyii]|nr:hypothetical protein [Cellulomonas shaoxiangyii]